MTGGSVIGLTSTTGNKDDIEEFRTVNKLLAFYIQRFSEYKGIKTKQEVLDQNTQYAEMLAAINEDTTRPIIIFYDKAKEVEEVFMYTIYHKPLSQIQLFSASSKDTIEKVTEVLKILVKKNI